jgi:hypothetical protein
LFVRRETQAKPTRFQKQQVFFAFPSDPLEYRMQIQDEEFPYTSDDPSLFPAEEKNDPQILTSELPGDLKASLRLVVGSALNGKDAYIQRLRRAQAAQELVKPETIKIDELESSREQLRYLLLGILFETPDLLQRGVESVEKTSAKAYGFFAKLFSPIGNSWIFRPVKNQYDTAAARGEKVIDRLVMKGRIEEQNSRQLIQQKVIDELVNEFLEYVILKTEVQQIIQDGGISMAGGLADEFREQSAAIDTLLEQKFKSIFWKSGSSRPVTPQNQLAEGE